MSLSEEKMEQLEEQSTRNMVWFYQDALKQLHREEETSAKRLLSKRVTHHLHNQDILGVAHEGAGTKVILTEKGAKLLEEVARK